MSREERALLDGSLTSALDGYDPERISDSNLEDSAVVLSIVEPSDHRDELMVVFVRRSEDRPRHPGEIGLPGGRTEPEDDSVRETAIREYEEEAGVSSDRLELVGRLDDVSTPSGYRIAPFVGVVDSEATFERQVEEIDELLFVPLASLIEQRDRRGGSENDGTASGRDDEQPTFEYDGEEIWGATGRIVATFLTLVR